jgi:hypothetical protein
MRMAALVAASFMLSACMGGNGAGPLGLLSPKEASDDALRELSLYRGAVVVRAPQGYCVDTAHVTRRPSATVVPLATCSSLTGEGYATVEPALMTVSVLPRGAAAEQPTADDLAESLAPATVTDAEDGDGLALVRVTKGAPSLPDSDPNHWRGAMAVNGHVVALAVYGRSGGALSGGQGRRLILDLAENLRDASMTQAAPRDAGSNLSRERAPQRRNAFGGFLSGLFPNSG